MHCREWSESIPELLHCRKDPLHTVALGRWLDTRSMIEITQSFIVPWTEHEDGTIPVSWVKWTLSNHPYLVAFKRRGIIISSWPDTRQTILFCQVGSLEALHNGLEYDSQQFLCFLFSNPCTIWQAFLEDEAPWLQLWPYVFQSGSRVLAVLVCHWQQGNPQAPSN